MPPDVIQQTAEYFQNRKRRKRWQRIVTCLGAAVVFCTTYALILPAITIENDPICGIEEHQHSESCYESLQTEQLDANITCVLDTHIHTPKCYNAEGHVICGLSDRIVHSHNTNCYYNDQLVCPLPEVEEHLHDETCYETTSTLTCELGEDYHRHIEECFTVELGELTCGQEEQDPHYHTDGCYEWINTLICEIQDDSEHQHTEACFSLEKSALICVLEEHDGHRHTDECREQTTTLICEIPSNPEGHQHSDTCYETASALTCELEQIAVHIHTEECYDENELLICGILSAQAHQHTEECLTLSSTGFVEEQVLTCTLEEHTHEESCYPSAEPEVSPEETESVDEAKYTCGYETHLHDETCYDADGNLTCLLPEHEHTEECTTAAEDNSTEEAPEQTETTDETEYVCGYEAHTHDEFCYDSEGSLICTLPVHQHTEECVSSTKLSETEQFLLDEVIALLDALPAYDEVDAALLAYEEAEDWDGYESYYVEVGQQGRYAYEQYTLLSEEAKALVTNADKLWDLEWLWSMVTLEKEVVETTIILQNADVATAELLFGSVFDLYLAAEEGEGVVIPGTERAGVVSASGVLVHTVTVEPSASLTLTVGETYYLVQTRVQAGYSRLISPIGFTVTQSDDGTVTVALLSDETRATVGVDSNSLPLLTVTNPVGYTLPDTGGIGTGLYTMGGLLFLTGAGVLLLYHYTHRKEGSDTS